MTPGQRLRFEHLTDATRRQTLTPTVEDIRILLKEVERLEHENAQLDHALDAALWTATEAAYMRLFPDRRS